MKLFSNSILKLFLCTIILFVSILGPISSNAQNQPSTENDTEPVDTGALSYVPLAPLPGIGIPADGMGSATPVNIASYAAGIFRLAIGLAAALAVLMITIGGVEYIGSDTITSKESGRTKINQALLGLFLAMGAWLILYTVNPALTRLNFIISPIENVESPPTTQARERAMLESLSSYPEDRVYKFRICIQASGIPGRTVEHHSIYQQFPYSDYQDQPGRQRGAFSACVNNDPPAGVAVADTEGCLQLTFFCTTHELLRLQLRNQ